MARLRGRRLIALDVGALVAGTQYRGSFEQRMTDVLREVRDSRGRIILFVDEIHTLGALLPAGLSIRLPICPAPPSVHRSARLSARPSVHPSVRRSLAMPMAVRRVAVSAGQVEGGLDAANLLKPALARGELHCIGATTVEEYRKHVESDAAFARRFQARGFACHLGSLHARWRGGRLGCSRRKVHRLLHRSEVCFADTSARGSPL
jgi:ATP-dependent Clp protease ATP-binding subunit ClpB